MDQGFPVIYRSSRIGGKDIDEILASRLGVNGNMTAQIKFDLGHLQPPQPWYELFAPIIEPIIKEIQYSFDLYLHQSGNEQKQPEKIILTGGASLFPPIASLIQKSFSVRVFVGDPWARVVYQQELKEIIDTLGPRMAVSIGLALRRIIV
jgi:Tfp pilus assembly PilM family ATPase